MKEEMIDRILDNPQYTYISIEDHMYVEDWQSFSMAMRDIVNGKDVEEAVAIIRQKWLEAAEKYADTQYYKEIMGIYPDDREELE